MNLSSELNFLDRTKKNLGSFNNHYLDPAAKKMFFDYCGVNANDSFTYPEISIMRQFCGEFLLSLSAADNFNDFQYHTTSGSSEAVFLGLLTLKRHFQESYSDTKLNVIVPSNAHVCWKKAVAFLDLELREVLIDKKCMVLNPNDVLMHIDVNTIGVCATLGTPTTLLFDPIFELNNALADYYRKTKRFIPIHVDAASGGFVAPFMFPDLIWDFRLPHVYTINISSHKYGMIYPCLGWLLTRNLPCLKKMTHENDYLGNNMQRISLQFSHSAAHLVTQYHQIKSFGFDGYQLRIKQLFDVMTILKQTLMQQEEFYVLDTTQHAYLPGVVFGARQGFNLNAFADQLKNRGWYLPVYRLPAPHQQKDVARVVIRHGFSLEMIQELVPDMHACFSYI